MTDGRVAEAIRNMGEMSRMLVELLHIAAGLVAAVVLTALCAWAYPHGRAVIWACGAGAMVAVVVMGIVPFRRALRTDRRERGR